MGRDWEWAAACMKASELGADFTVNTGEYDKATGNYIFLNKKGMELIVTADGDVVIGELREVQVAKKVAPREGGRKESKAMAKEVVSFKGRKYQFEQTIVTLISSEYVPDWDLVKAVKESVQNMMDERTETGCTTDWFLGDPVVINFRDGGRGVDLEQIFLIGDSGKRGRDDLVGQHGEGEVVSFMVAARLNVVKTMASQDWLARGRLDEMSGRQVLHLDIFRSKSARKGTAWCYEGEGVRDALKTSLEHYRVKIEQVKRQERYERQQRRAATKRVEKRKQKRARMGILNGEPSGYLYTNGQWVCQLDELALAYNLKATPGRDRAAFAWENVKWEIEEILNAEAKQAHVETLLRSAIRNGAENVREFSLDLDLDVKMVQRAVRKVTGSRSLKKLGWASFGQHASYLSDAADQGIQVLGFHDAAPTWITNALHCVTKLTGSGATAQEKPLPKALAEACEIACQLMNPAANRWIEFKGVWTSTKEGERAYASSGKIVLIKKQMKEVDGTDFLGIIAHELGHADGGYPDCTRGHEAYVRELMGEAVMRVANDKTAAKLYRRMVKLVDGYGGR